PADRPPCVHRAARGRPDRGRRRGPGGRRRLTSGRPDVPRRPTDRHRRLAPMPRRWWSALRAWPYTFGVALAAAVGILAIVLSARLGIALKDPEGFLGPAYVRLPVMGLAFFAIGVVPAAIRRAGWRHMVRGIREIVRDEWTWGRVGHIATGLLTFYVCYVSYRNIKGFLPVLREGVNFDGMLTRWDYWLM